MATERAVSMAVKISFGNALCALVVFVPALTYPSSSQASIMFMISAAMFTESSHVGKNISSAVLTALGGYFGAVFAGIVLLLADNDVGITCLCVLVVFPLYYLLRFGNHPK